MQSVAALPKQFSWVRPRRCACAHHFGRPSRGFNETHLHQHHVCAPNIYQHSQTVNVVSACPSTEEVAAYASARHDAIINQVEAGHVEEKGRLYQDAVNHINVCQQEAMAKEREFNEAKQQWVALNSSD